MRYSKQTLAAIFICLAVIFTGLAGCAGEAEPAPTSTAPPATTTPPATPAPPTATAAPTTPAEPEKPAFQLEKDLVLPDTFTLATANTDPTALTKSVAALLSKHTPMEVEVAMSRSNSDAHIRLADGAGILSISTGGCVPCHRVAIWSTAQSYYDGTIFSIGGTVGIEPADRGNLRALFTNTPNDTSMWAMAGVVTLADSGIQTVADLKGKKVNARNSNVLFIEPIMQAILAANGMTNDDIEWVSFAGGADAMETLGDGTVDATCYIFGDDVLDLAKDKAVYVLPLSAETQQAVTEIEYGYLAAELPADVIPGVLATPVVGSPYVAWVASETPDDVAYAITRTVLENLDELHAEQELSINFTKENALSQWRFPYHPGAIRYYQSIGVWTAEMDQLQADLLKKWSS